MNDKKSLRAALGDIAITDPHRQATELIPHLEKLLEKTSGVIACYCAMPDEVELATVWNDERERFVFPRVEKNHGMSFFRIGKRGFISGAYGILEPNDDAELVPQQEIRTVICPGVAFTKKGIRLGRGAGYYDRWLAAYGEKMPTLIGVAFRERLLDFIPAESHDVTMDYVVTADGVTRCHP